MVFSRDDRILIKELRKSKGCGARMLLKEFPLKNWSLSGLSYLIKKVDATGSSDRKLGSGRPRSARTNENITEVEELILSQDSQPGTHSSMREVAREVGMSAASVHRIVHKDIRLKCLKKKPLSS